jgi:hypothetical protein
MRQLRTFGSVGASGGQPLVATRSGLPPDYPGLRIINCARSGLWEPRAGNRSWPPGPD